MKKGKGRVVYFLIFAAIVAFVTFTLYFVDRSFVSEDLNYSSSTGKGKGSLTLPIAFVPDHVKTPTVVRAVYMTSWVAGTPSIRSRVVKLIDETEINSIVIDIKDATGKIAYVPEDPELIKVGAGENRIADIKQFIASLHKKGIYVIGRVSVFQDPHLVAKRPDLAVVRSDGKTIWRDRKGISWIDAGAQECWEYVARIAEESYKKIGFDEINFDYIRFPSDGDMQDISYRHFDATKISKSDELQRFFSYLDDRLAPSKMPISADLFGMTTTVNDDMNIGQVLEKALPYFDFVAPMIYPSHYPATWEGFANPAAHPYEVVKLAMEGALTKTRMASSSPQKLRPWIQDFNMGATYDAKMVRDQIRALNDLGLDSYMVWDPRNVYTKGAYEAE